jgi:hypothetical protein
MADIIVGASSEKMNNCILDLVLGTRNGKMGHLVVRRFENSVATGKAQLILTAHSAAIEQSSTLARWISTASARLALFRNVISSFDSYITTPPRSRVVVVIRSFRSYMNMPATTTTGA